MPPQRIPFTTPGVRNFAIALGLLAVAGCGDDPEIIVPEVLSVVGIFPTFGSSNVETDIQPYVYFSHPIADPADAATKMSISCLGAPPCSAPDSSACSGSPTLQVSVAADRFSARLTPNAPLSANTCHVVIIGEGLAAEGENVGPLPSDLRSSFQTTVDF